MPLPLTTKVRRLYWRHERTEMKHDTPPVKAAMTDQLGAGSEAMEQWRRRLWELIDSYRKGEDWPQICRDRIKGHLANLPAFECMEMALCERHKLVLRVGQPYIFAPVGDCESCAADLAAAREAYGPSAGAPNDQGEAPLLAP